MRTIKIYCKTCGIALTEPLLEINESNLRMDDATDALQKGQFAIATWNDQTALIVSLGEGYLKDHPETWRFQGCCGSSGSSGLNKLCSNGHEIATEFSDCYMPHYIKFDKECVVIKQSINDHDYKQIMI